MLAMMAQPLLTTLNGDPVPVEPLQDGEVIPFGTDVRVVQVPGHTEGSIAIYLPEKGTNIVGDALQYKFARRLSPPAAGVTSDPSRRCVPSRSSWSWTSVSCASGTFLRCGTIPKAALRKLIEQQESGQTPV